jgi:hypothetical protein
VVATDVCCDVQEYAHRLLTNGAQADRLAASQPT